MTIPSPTRRSAPGQVTKLLERLAFQVSGTRHSHDPEAIHDLRVAIRRFTQSLTVFKPCFVGKELKKIRRCLSHIMDLAGEVRDCDIALEYVSELRSPETAALETAFSSRRRQAESALLASLRDWVMRGTSSKWRTALEPVEGAMNLPCYKVDTAAQSAVPKTGRDFFKSGNRAAGSESSAGELHHFRIAAKKFRYTLELFAPFYGPAARDWLDRITRLQSLLGRINDCRTVRRMVSGLDDDGRIEAALKKKQRRKTLEFRRLWADEFSSTAAKHWMRALERPPNKPAGRARIAQAACMAAGA